MKYLLIYARIANIFLITLTYLTRSYSKKSSLITLKKEWALEVLNYLGYDLVISGNPPPSEAPRILVGNHFSFLDILVVIAAEPAATFLAKKEVQNIPIIGRAAKRVGTLFVDRSSKEDRSQKKSEISRLISNQKACVIVFPSGTTTWNEELPWKKGIFEIAQDGNIKVFSFKVAYNCPEVSSFINDETMVGQLAKALPIKGKKAQLHWLTSHSIQNPSIDCESIRIQVQNHKLLF